MTWTVYYYLLVPSVVLRINLREKISEWRWDSFVFVFNESAGIFDEIFKGNSKNNNYWFLFLAVIIEKLLRTCDIESIYILIRAKKNDDIHTRLNKIFDDSVIMG